MISKIEHLSDTVTLYLGDAREIVPSLIAPINVVITSPPYAQQRDYGQKIVDWRGLVSGVICNIRDAGDTQIFVNLGLIHQDGEVFIYWGSFLDDMRTSKWRLFGWYVWDKGPAIPGDWHGRLAPTHEFIFHFNRISRKPNKTIPCVRAGKFRGTKSGMRKADGKINQWTAINSPVQPFRICDSVLRINRHKSGDIGHPAVFPVALPHELIASYTNPGEMVFDPFMGSGTTGIATVKTGRKFIGIEIEPKYFDIACKRINEALANPDMFMGNDMTCQDKNLTMDSV